MMDTKRLIFGGKKVLSFSNKEASMKESKWGGRRQGAGRPPTGRKRVTLYLTEEEEKEVREYVLTLRRKEKKIIITGL